MKSPRSRRLRRLVRWPTIAWWKGAGQHVLSFVKSPFGMLELANVDWTTDEGRPALRFAENASGRREYPRNGSLDLNYLRHPSYQDKQTLPVAVAGMHGGGDTWKAFTISALIKPAPEMGHGAQRGKGDIVGLGARRFILGLKGQTAPYHLWARINVNDSVVADAKPLEADRWYHVAMTGEPTPSGQWKIKLYVDGEAVAEGETKQFAAPRADSAVAHSGRGNLLPARCLLSRLDRADAHLRSGTRAGRHPGARQAAMTSPAFLSNGAVPRHTSDKVSGTGSYEASLLERGGRLG